MRAGGPHERSHAAHVLRWMRARKRGEGVWPAEDVVLDSFDENADWRWSAAEITALGETVGDEWPERRVRDVLRGCL